MIEIRNVSLRLDGKSILNNISLTLEPGKIYGLVGSNGSGKTMLMKCICGFVHPTDGEIKTDGRRVGKDVDYLPNASQEKGGEPGDIYFDVTFREWKNIAVRTESEEQQSKRVAIKERPKLVKINTDDDLFGTEESLWKIAKQHYGNGESWTKILEANAGQITKQVILP